MSEESSHSDSDTRSLTTRMAQGDEAAYREFFEAYFDRILRYLLVVSHGQEEAARDAVQRTLARVVKHMRPFDSAEVFWSWLTLLARCAWGDEQRKLGRYLGFLERFRNRQTLESAPATDHQADNHLWTLLEEQIRQLPDEERMLIERKYLDGQAVAEISLHHGLSEKALESRLIRIRRKLKDQVLQQLNHEQT